MSNRKSITKDAVKEAAEDLIKQNGETTTLDVKNSLRNSGYFAKQDEVSQIMLEIGTEESWQINNNGIYRIYSFDQNVGSISGGNQFGKTNYANQTSSNSGQFSQVASQPNFRNSNIQSYVIRKGPKKGTTIYSKSVRDAGDWKSYSKTSNSPEMYFSSKYTRDEVRIAYSKIVGIKFQDVLASRRKL